MKTSIRILSLVLALGLLLAGCTGGAPGSSANSAPASQPSAGQPASSSAAPSSAAEPTMKDKIGKYPIADASNPITLKIWSTMSEILPKNIKDFGEIMAFQEMEKATGIKIEWQHAVAGQDTEAFNLMLASRDLPDLIRKNIGSAGWEASKYVDQDVIIDIAPYAEYAPNFFGIVNGDPELKRQLTDDNGGVYFFPSLNKDVGTRTYRGFLIRQDWLDKAGLAMPQNTDDLYNVLKKWQEIDVNGNGKKDEYFTGVDVNKQFEIYSLLWSFGADWRYTVENGKVTHGLMTPEFKEGMEYIVKLYAEGLIDPDFLTHDNTKWEAQFISEVAGASYGIASRIDKFTKGVQGSSFKPIPILNGPQNRKQKSFDPTITTIFKTQQTVCITTANKHVEESMMWMDWVYGPDGELMFTLGKEGVSFETVNGKLQYTEAITKDPKGRPQNEMQLLFAPGGSQWPVNITMDQIRIQKTPVELDAFLVYGANVPDTSSMLPPVSLLPEEIAQISSKLTDIDTYVAEAMGSLTIGKTSIDKIETEVIPRLKQLGVEDVIKVYQAAYDRYMAKA